jgi:thiol:disulfide interchange protein DsbC
VEAAQSCLFWALLNNIAPNGHAIIAWIPVERIPPMKLFSTLLATVGLASALMSPARADEASVKQAFETQMRTTVERVTKTDHLGMYEIYASGQILYTDEKVSVVFAGPMLDPKTMRNLTAERMKILSAVKISDLPLDLAVKTVRGNGSRTLVTFEDPNCGYCKKVAQDLAQLKDVTIYTFMYAILSPDSTEKVNQVWCSKDRAKAWNSMMLEGKMPAAKSDCATPVQKVQEIGRKYAITGTPTLIFASGERVPGAISAGEIEQRLSRTSQ